MERTTLAENLPKGLKVHEARLQERRQDRRSEIQRLDNLKKTLQSKLKLDSSQQRNIRVA
jgi:hypothetical protein